MNCCAYRLVCITMYSIICSVVYSLKKSCAVGFLGRGTSILSSAVNFTFLVQMELLDIFYSTATEDLIADCVLVQLVSESQGWHRLYSALPMTCWSLHCTSRVLFILSMTCWDLFNIFCTLFILPMTC